MNQQEFNQLLQLLPEHRDAKGKLTTRYFKKLATIFNDQTGHYDQGEFKSLIKGSKILKKQDWLSDGSHPFTWRHRAERATQRINQGI